MSQKKRIQSKIEQSLKRFAPPPKLTVTQWAERNRYLSSEASAEAGKYRVSRAPYQQEMQDAVSDPDIEEIVFRTGSQLGKSEILLNILGYHVDKDPAPVLMVYPTDSMAKTFAQDRIAPMIRDCPSLRRKFDRASKKSTTLRKRFEGGHVTLVSSQSPSELAARPVRIVLFDEVDRFAISSGHEGDPINLARQRTATFHNRKLVAVSTPTIEGQSRIDQLYQDSDQRQLLVPCPYCSEYQPLLWRQVQWPDGEPQKAQYQCQACEAYICHSQKQKMLSQSKWEPQNPENKTRIGFHLNALASPWTSWGSLAEEFFEAKDDRQLLQVFVNTKLGEVYEDQDTKELPWEMLSRRREEYQHTVPNDVVALIAGVDVQDDRLEYEIRGYDEYYNSYGIEYKVLYGDPAFGEIWDELDQRLTRPFRHATGKQIYVMIATVDTGGHYTQMVYRFVERNPRYYAVKGSSYQGVPLIKRSKATADRPEIYMVGTVEAKDLIFSRLWKDEGPGAYHWPASEDAGYDQEYFKQLTGEKRVRTYRRGHEINHYVKIRRNEALDVNVYILAGLHILLQRTTLDEIAKYYDDRNKIPKQRNINRRVISYYDDNIDDPW